MVTSCSDDERAAADKRLAGIKQLMNLERWQLWLIWDHKVRPGLGLTFGASYAVLERFSSYVFCSLLNVFLSIIFVFYWCFVWVTVYKNITFSPNFHLAQTKTVNALFSLNHKITLPFVSCDEKTSDTIKPNWIIFCFNSSLPWNKKKTLDDCPTKPTVGPHL